MLELAPAPPESGSGGEGAEMASAAYEEKCAGRRRLSDETTELDAEKGDMLGTMPGGKRAPPPRPESCVRMCRPAGPPPPFAALMPWPRCEPK